MIFRYNSTEKIKEFFTLFAEKKIDLDYAAQNFKYHPKFNRKKFFQLNFYVRSFLAHHRKRVINEILLEHDELRIKFPNEGNSNKCQLKTDISKRCFFYSSKDELTCSSPMIEFDNYVIIGNVPTLINFRYRRFPRRGEEKSGLILKLFGSNVAYGVVTTKDNINKYYGRAKNFVSRGGFVTVLPINKKELKNEIKIVCKYHGISVIEDEG